MANSLSAKTKPDSSDFPMNQMFNGLMELKKNILRMIFG
jgi:hypothetical protein